MGMGRPVRRSGQSQDFLETFAERTHQKLGIVNRPPVHVHADAAAVHVREQCDIDRSTTRGSERVLPQDLGSGKVGRGAQTWDIGGDEVDISKQ